MRAHPVPTLRYTTSYPQKLCLPHTHREVLLKNNPITAFSNERETSATLAQEMQNLSPDPSPVKDFRSAERQDE